MTDSSANNKRIAKNTLLLYARMLFMMVVSLYTSRVVLNALGVEDFGIYNVVGGVVTMFSMLSGSLSAAITRFITYELGTGNKENLRRIFSSSVTIQIGLAVLIILLAEAIGVWFLNAKMNIPETRMAAANWVFQFSVLTFAVNLISVPYNASIIAHERMSAFAYISILEAVGKLAIAFLIVVSPIDKLIFYAILMCAVALVVRFAYGIYCKRHFEECTYHFIFDKDLLKRMFGFAGWNFIGASSAVLREHGGNVIINLFCGPTVNAARGISAQVNTALQSFVYNFMTALNPQITKSYAAGDRKYMMVLVFQGARLSFYMLLLLSLPVIVSANYILELWLTTVPDHTVMFVRLVLIFALSESLSHPLVTVMLASGRIRNYQLVVGGLQMMNFPVSYILLHLGFFPEIVIIVAILISQCCLVARLIMLRNMVGMEIKSFIKNVYLNVTLVAILSLILLSIISVFVRIDNSFVRFVIMTVVSLVSTAISIFYVGCSKDERKFIIGKLSVISRKYIDRKS